MMKIFKEKKLKYLLLLASLILVIPSYAGQSGSGTLKTLQTAYGGWIFNINTSNNNPEGCSKSTMILTGHGQQDQIYSLLLAAAISAKPVLVYTNGCDANGYNKVTGVYVHWNPS